MKRPTAAECKNLWLCLTLALATFAIFSPAIRCDFLTYDDQQYVTENPHVQAGLTRDSVLWAFGFHASNWHPLTWLSHMLDCQLYGLNPAGHHLTNILLHTANTVLLFLVLKRITGTFWRSAAVAALFGWHPLHVESVAWIAERKDVLSTLFWILSMWAYAQYTNESKLQSPKPKSAFYFLALIFFILGLMSKPMLVTLPFVFLLLDYWPFARIGLGWKRLTFEKIPFLGFSVAVSVLTLLAQHRAYAIVSTAGLPLAERLSHAVLAYVHYLRVTFWPCHLAVYYPYERVVSTSAALGATLFLIAITGLALWFARTRPYLPVGWFWYLGTLVPVIGLVQVGDQAWADRYTYIPLIGLFIALVWGAAHAVRSVVVLRVLGTGVAASLLIATWQQISFWENTRSLFEHAAKVTRNNYRAVTVLGSLLAMEGKLDEAKKLYALALEWNPTYLEAHFFLGHALVAQGNIPEAVAQYRKALGYKPIEAETHISLGQTLAKLGKHAYAEQEYRAALKVNPGSAVAHNNLARLLHSQGRLDDAITEYQQAIKTDPNLAQAHNNLGVLFLQAGKTSEGIAEIREALSLRPNDPESEYNLAAALVGQQKWSEATELLARAISRTRADPNIYYQYGVALAGLGRTRQALSQFASAILLKQDFPEALDRLAWLLSTSDNPELRNGAEAVRMAERACELTKRQDPEKLKTLAAAYAESGRYDDAKAAIQAAHDLASEIAKEPLRQQCSKMLETFESAKPWRGQQ